MTPRSALRLSRRLSRSLATTMTLWACLDAEVALSRPDVHEELLHKWVRRWARSLLRTLGVTLICDGLYIGSGNAYPETAPNGRGRVFVMNHRSALDILVTFATLEAHLVSRHDLASWPLIGRGARRLGTLFVDRASSGSGASVMKLMTRLLSEGRAVAIYPEGTAYSGDEVREFKAGAFMAARRAGAEIIPLGIAYDRPEAYYGDESFGAHVQRVVAVPDIRVALVSGAPITDLRRPLADVAAEARLAVQQLVRDARALL